jgi:hypothetical protein
MEKRRGAVSGAGEGAIWSGGELGESGAASFLVEAGACASVSLTFDANINLNERLSLRGRENSITLRAPCILM